MSTYLNARLLTVKWLNDSPRNATTGIDKVSQYGWKSRPLIQLTPRLRSPKYVCAIP